jgi:CheY-like chemotaxis protein
MMREMNGYEVLERLNADEVLRHVPVIMIWAISKLDSVVLCIELGAEDYLPKPFNSILLRARIGASLERKRLHDREAEHLAEIERQRARADQLLHAILPAPAVAELKANDRITPRRFESVAVYFGDVVGFTASAIAIRRRRSSPAWTTWPPPSRASPAPTASRRSRPSAMRSWRRPICWNRTTTRSWPACAWPSRWRRRPVRRPRYGRCGSASTSVRSWRVSWD